MLRFNLNFIRLSDIDGIWSKIPLKDPWNILWLVHLCHFSSWLFTRTNLLRNTLVIHLMLYTLSWQWDFRSWWLQEHIGSDFLSEILWKDLWNTLELCHFRNWWLHKDVFSEIPLILHTLSSHFRNWWLQEQICSEIPFTRRPGHQCSLYDTSFLFEGNIQWQYFDTYIFEVNCNSARHL